MGMTELPPICGFPGAACSLLGGLSMYDYAVRYCPDQDAALRDEALLHAGIVIIVHYPGRRG